jgi:hypothetical protein
MTEQEHLFDCSPSTHMLQSAKNRSWTWKQCLAELIDNSFDHGALLTLVEFLPNRTVRVKDDGEGITNIQRLLKYGEHVREKKSRKQSGLYGVGFNDASWWFWGILKVTTLGPMGSWTTEIDWDEFESANSWIFPQRPAITIDGFHGTEFIFKQIQKQFPSIPELVSELSFEFTPGLREGKQLRIVPRSGDPILCRPYQLPEFIEKIDHHFTINGKEVHLVAGVVKEGTNNLRPGISLCRAHRIIDHGAIGANGYSIDRIAGYVELEDKWCPSTHKNSLTDKDKDALHVEIGKRCDGIFRIGQKQAETQELHDLTHSVEEDINKLISEIKKRRREKRHHFDHPPLKPGVNPTNSEKERLHAKEVTDNPGKILDPFADQLAKKLGGQVKIFWLDNTTNKMKMVSSEILPETIRVTFNTAHPMVRRIKESKNLEMIKYMLVQSIVEESWNGDKWRDVFPTMKNYTSLHDVCGAVLYNEFCQAYALQI